MLAPTPPFTLWTRDLRPGVGPNATVQVVDKGSTAGCWPQRHRSSCGQGIYGRVLAPTPPFTLWTRDLRPGVGPNATVHVVDKGSTAGCWPQRHRSSCGQGIYGRVLAPTPPFKLWTRDLRPGVGPNATVQVADKGSTAGCWPQRHRSRCGQGIYGRVLAPTRRYYSA